MLLGACTSQNQEIKKSEAMKEIDRLLLPVATQNITESDFTYLETITSADAHAQDEIYELKMLARYKEFSHVGHGLASLYEYEKTGEEQNCPGHYVAHYYVFMQHGETELAGQNLAEAKESLEALEDPDILVSAAMDRIMRGNSSASKEEISALADAPCVKE